ISVGGLMAFIPGPDLPGGGHIISPHEDIRAIYENGRGSLRMRARWTFEELARGQWRIAVTELPFGVSTREVLEDIERATNPRPKEGKKSLTQDQVNLKQIVEEWIGFRFETVTRRTKYRLGEVDHRIHILEGRQQALLSIDKVIRVIRKSDDPKADLIATFGLTAIQADDILEIRLRQ